MSQHIDPEVKQSFIVDNLTTDDAGKALSAKQGKALDNKITTLNGNSDPLIGTGKAWLANADLNDYKTTGMYYFSTGTKIGGVADSAFNWCTLVVFAGKTDTLIQTVYRSDGAKISTRHFRNNAWTSFITLYEDIATLNSKTTTLEEKGKSIIKTTSDFTSWTFTVPKQTGAGILMGFDEIWAFSWASSTIGAKQITHAMRSQGDRGFTFSMSDATTITVTTTGTVWGGATVIV